MDYARGCCLCGGEDATQLLSGRYNPHRDLWLLICGLCNSTVPSEVIRTKVEAIAKERAWMT